MRNRTTITSLALSVAFVGFVSKSPGQVVIRPDKKITRITEPLDESGRVDYLEALNQRYSQGVTAATNWEIALLKEFGAPKLAPESLQELWRRLGIPPIQPDRDQPILQGYRFGDEYSELDNKANESFMNSIGPWTAVKFPHEARWLGMRKSALDRLVDASTRPHNYVPQVTSAEDHTKIIREAQSFFSARGKSKDPDERLAAAVGAMLTSELTIRAAPLSRLHGVSSIQNNRELARMLYRRALLRIGEGDIQGAQSDLVAIHRVGWLTGQGNLSQWMTGTAIEEMASMGDLDLVESGKMTRAECEQYLRLLRRLPTHRKAIELMDIELRYQALDAIQFAAAHHEETMGQLAEDDVGDEQALNRIRNVEWSEVMRRVNRMFDEQIALHRSPEGRDEPLNSKNTPVPQDQQQQAKALIERATAGQAELTEFIAQMYFNQVSLPQLRNVELRPKTRRQVVKAGLAAELYRFAHGGYPKSLEPLKPMVDEPLIDALNGKPIQLKKLDKGVLIYAFGLNGTDDGGLDIGRLRSWSGTGPTPDDIAVRLEQP